MTGGSRPSRDLSGFPARLRLARAARGLSMRALSEALGGAVSAMSISKYENGKAWPRSSVLIALADQLGVGMDFLAGGEVTEVEITHVLKSHNRSRWP